MSGRIRVLLFVVLSGLLLCISPGARLSNADDEPVRPAARDAMESATIQFLLVQIERDTLEENAGESNVLTLDSISLEAVGRCIHDEEGADIVSQIKLTVAGGHEAEMTFVENERRKEKNADEGHGEQGLREAEVFVWIKAGFHDGDRLAARFTYRRSVVEEGSYSGQKAEEAEGIEQKFEISSGIVLHAGRACIAGANMTEEIATFLIVKADSIDHRHEGPVR